MNNLSSLTIFYQIIMIKSFLCCCIENINKSSSVRLSGKLVVQMQLSFIFLILSLSETVSFRLLSLKIANMNKYFADEEVLITWNNWPTILCKKYQFTTSYFHLQNRPFMFCINNQP